MRTTVNIDPALVEAASKTLNTQGVSETINAALADVSRRARLQDFDVRIFDITDEDVASARKDRLSEPGNNE